MLRPSGGEKCRLVPRWRVAASLRRKARVPVPGVSTLQRLRPSPEPRSRGLVFRRPVLLGPVDQAPSKLLLQPVSTGFGCQPPSPPRKAPHTCKIAPTPPPGNLFFISLSPFLSTPSPASPPERATPPGKMRIETARDKVHRQRSRTSPGKAADQPAKFRGTVRAALRIGTGPNVAVFRV